MDKATHELAQKLGLVSFYHETFQIESSAAIYGTFEYARVVMAKVWSVHLISALNLDFWFLDVDIVPLSGDAFNYLTKLSKKYNFDLLFQDDHTDAEQYQPWSANSGLYFVRSNGKTRYLLSRLLRMGDVLLKTKSHQATFSILLSEVVNQYGLRVKVLTKESESLPGGYHFHQDWDYMRALMKDKVHPRLFHMNWNENVETKRMFLQQMGAWYVQDDCRSGECCRTPEPVCFYRDKPSKLDCSKYPSVEYDVTFW
jgi:hypothetical protein